MKRRVKRESRNRRVVVDIIFYLIMCVLGYLFIEYENFNIRYDYSMISCIFFVLAFCSSFAYIFTRRKNDYEYLIFCIINFLAGAYVYGSYYYGRSFVIGDALLVYSAACILCKLYTARILWKNKDTNFIFKVSNAVILTIISVFAVYSLYTKEEVSNMIIGYYLIGSGLLNMFEPLFYIILSNPNIDTFLISVLKYNRDLNTPKKKLREIPKKKIGSKTKTEKKDD